MRPKDPAMVRARARTSSVLPSPGTPSTSTWPPASSAQSTASTTAFWPTSARATSVRMAAATFAACWNCSALGAVIVTPGGSSISPFECSVYPLRSLHDLDERGAANRAAGVEQALRFLGANSRQRGEARGALLRLRAGEL